MTRKNTGSLPFAALKIISVQYPDPTREKPHFGGRYAARCHSELIGDAATLDDPPNPGAPVVHNGREIGKVHSWTFERDRGMFVEAWLWEVPAYKAPHANACTYQSIEDRVVDAFWEVAKTNARRDRDGNKTP